MIALERLRHLLEYDQETGTFTWRVCTKGHASGRAAGYRTARGEIRIGVDGERYLAHRLAWFYCFGEWPVEQIDHIDGNTSNNRLGNLRDVSGAVNSQNVRIARPFNKSSGVLGVGYYPHLNKTNPYYVQLVVGGKRVFCTQFDSLERAQAAYIEAKRVHHKGCTL